MANADEIRPIIEAQLEYYDARADDYGDESKPPDRKIRGMVSESLGRKLVDEFKPRGEVLELACGTGLFTRDLIRFARSVTAVDGSPRMLDINKRRLGDPKVAYVEADLFGWKPPRTFDAVFFGFWLSHVPPSAFDGFWELVRAALAPGGRVAFVDEDERAAAHDDTRSVGGVPIARRSLSDGRQFEIVKVFWRPEELQDRLASLEWDVEVRRVGDSFLFGVGQPRDP